MKKMIKIDNTEYFMQSSAYTQFAYKNETGRSLLADLESLISITRNKNENDYSVDDLDKCTELVLKIAYIMIQEADPKQSLNYESFIKSIDSLYDKTDWIEEVILLACTPISRQLQNLKK